MESRSDISARPDTCSTPNTPLTRPRPGSTWNPAAISLLDPVRVHTNTPRSLARAQTPRGIPQRYLCSTGTSTRTRPTHSPEPRLHVESPQRYPARPGTWSHAEHPPLTRSSHAPRGVPADISARPGGCSTWNTPHSLAVSHLLHVESRSDISARPARVPRGTRPTHSQ